MAIGLACDHGCWEDSSCLARRPGGFHDHNFEQQLTAPYGRPWTLTIRLGWRPSVRVGVRTESGEPMRRYIVVVGASAGGVEALRTLVAGLSPELPATVLVVLHVPPHARSVLPAILDRAGPLRARHAVGGDQLTYGDVLVARPDHHLALHDSTVLLTRGPRENDHRPSVDVLFRTAARAAGARVIGIVLSGVLDDGTAGLAAIHERGGVVVVQDPADALYPDMPSHAIEHVAVDHVTLAKDVGHLLDKLCAEDVETSEQLPSSLTGIETGPAMMDDAGMNDPDRPGRRSGFSCPDCAGTLFEIREGELARYRCRVGHAWSVDAFSASRRSTWTVRCRWHCAEWKRRRHSPVSWPSEPANGTVTSRRCVSMSRPTKPPMRLR